MSYLKSKQVPKRVKKKRPKNERKKLVKKLDEVVRQICRKRDKSCCSCGKRLNDTAQVSHYISRRVYAVRWDLRNCHMSCPGCNLRHNFDPSAYTSFMLRVYTDTIIDELIEAKNRVKKMTTPMLRELLQDLTNKE